MIEGEDSSDDLSAPLIISPSITIKDDIGEGPPDSRISAIVDKTASLQPPHKIFAQYPESALQPLMHDTLRAEDSESIANNYNGKRSQDQACQEKLINGVTEAVQISNEKRKVHWVDNYGENIAQVKEFQPSEQ